MDFGSTAHATMERVKLCYGFNRNLAILHYGIIEDNIGDLLTVLRTGEPSFPVAVRESIVEDKHLVFFLHATNRLEVFAQYRWIMVQNNNATDGRHEIRHWELPRST